MRLSFPNKEHDDTLIGAGDTRIGAAPDNTIVLDRPGIAAHHARLSVADRGIVLYVNDGARTHVNTRPVREKAILRLGDIISLDTLQFVLKPDRDDSILSKIPTATSITSAPALADPTDQARINPPKVLLRGVSGTRFGKLVPVRGKLVIGSGADADLVLDEPNMPARHAIIENIGDAIYLRDCKSSLGTSVNGVLVRDAVLHSGDQIAFERNRFVLEAPGLPSRGEWSVALPAFAPPVNITQTMKAIRLPDDAPSAAHAEPARERGSKNDIWWLIVAAALIAIGLALLFLVKV